MVAIWVIVARKTDTGMVQTIAEEALVRGAPHGEMIDTTRTVSLEKQVVLLPA